MQTVEPFDCTVEPGAVMIHSMPGLRHYNPIGSVHGGYAAILLNSAMGLAVQSTLPVGSGYTTLEFKISFVRGMSETSGVIGRGPRTQRGPPRRYRRGATPMQRISCLRMRRRRALCSNSGRGARKADEWHADGAGLPPTLNCLSGGLWNVGLRTQRAGWLSPRRRPNTLICRNDELVCC